MITRPLTLSPDDLLRPLTFWESGPIRQILELEFDLILEEELLCRGLTTSADVSNLIHDAVLPEVFLYVTRAIHWAESEERELALCLANRAPVRKELGRRISVQLKRLSPLLQPQVRKEVPGVRHARGLLMAVATILGG